MYIINLKYVILMSAILNNHNKETKFKMKNSFNSLSNKFLRENDNSVTANHLRASEAGKLRNV